MSYRLAGIHTMKKIRINELARELEVTNTVILDMLPELGVAEKRPTSSSIDEDVALIIKDRLANADRTRMQEEGATAPESRERHEPAETEERDEEAVDESEFDAAEEGTGEEGRRPGLGVGDHVTAAGDGEEEGGGDENALDGDGFHGRLLSLRMRASRRFPARKRAARVVRAVAANARLRGGEGGFGRRCAFCSSGTWTVEPDDHLLATRSVLRPMAWVMRLSGR